MMTLAMFGDQICLCPAKSISFVVGFTLQSPVI